MIYYGIFSIIPPMVSIILSLITKEVISSLFIGLVSGIIIHAFGTGLSFIDGVKSIIILISSSLSDNVTPIIFTAFLGALSRILLNCGSSGAYAIWFDKKIKSKKALQLSSVGLSFFLSIDDYFSGLTIGTIMKPIFDKHKISRTKLAYILDSTAAPLCVLMPISSWAAAIISCFKNSNLSGMGVLINTIPYNFYPILTIIFLIFNIFILKDFGPMQKFESLAEKGNDISSSDAVLEQIPNKNGKILNLVLPVITLIFVSIFMVFETGGFFQKKINILEVLSNSNASLAITVGAFSSIFCAFILNCVFKNLSFDKFMSSFSDGVKSMISSFMLLTLVWSMSSLCKNFLMTDSYVESLIINSKFPMSFFPLIIFIISSALSFSTGSSWGTFGILIPMSVSILSRSNSEFLVMSASAILSGSIFGTHCSPISDNTIMAAAGSGCKHLDHVTSQIPYSIIVAIASAFGFLLIGLTNNLFLSFGLASILMCLIFIFISNKSKKIFKI